MWSAGPIDASAIDPEIETQSGISAVDLNLSGQVGSKSQDSGRSVGCGRALFAPRVSHREGPRIADATVGPATGAASKRPAIPQNRVRSRGRPGEFFPISDCQLFFVSALGLDGQQQSQARLTFIPLRPESETRVAGRSFFTPAGRYLPFSNVRYDFPPPSTGSGQLSQPGRKNAPAVVWGSRPSGHCRGHAYLGWLRILHRF